MTAFINAHYKKVQAQYQQCLIENVNKILHHFIS